MMGPLSFPGVEVTFALHEEGHGTLPNTRDEKHTSVGLQPSAGGTTHGASGFQGTRVRERLTTVGLSCVRAVHTLAPIMEHIRYTLVALFVAWCTALHGQLPTNVPTDRIAVDGCWFHLEEVSPWSPCVELLVQRLVEPMEAGQLEWGYGWFHMRTALWIADDDSCAQRVPQLWFQRIACTPTRKERRLYTVVPK